MNHPSDYMAHYQDSSSSDESNLKLSQLVKYQNNKKQQKKKGSVSLIDPKKKEHKKSKKTKPSVIQKSPIKRNSKKIKDKRSISDLYVVGSSFYSCQNVDEISHRFIQNHEERIMMASRLKVKEFKCIIKIEKYVKTFLEFKRMRRLRKMHFPQKIQLYRLLKQEKQSQNQNNIIQDILRKSLETLQKKVQKLIDTYPTQNDSIVQWKNVKMHQLMTAQLFLLKEDQLSIDIFRLEKELFILNQQQFFPQMREDAHILQNEIKNYMRQTQNKKIKKLEDQMTDWVLSRLFDFILERQQQWLVISDKLRQYQYGVKRENLLTDRIYIEFEKQQIGQGENQEETSSRVYLHIFNKAILDLINETALSFQSIVPTVECLKDIFIKAKNLLIQEQWPIWRQEQFLLLGDMIFEQLLEDFLQDILDLY